MIIDTNHKLAAFGREIFCKEGGGEVKQHKNCISSYQFGTMEKGVAEAVPGYKSMVTYDLSQHHVWSDFAYEHGGLSVTRLAICACDMCIIAGKYLNQYEIGIVCAPFPGHTLDEKAPNVPNDCPQHMYYAFNKDSGKWYTRHQDDGSSTPKVVKKRRKAVHCKQLIPFEISTFGDLTSRSVSNILIEVLLEVDVMIKKMNLMRCGIASNT